MTLQEDLPPGTLIGAGRTAEIYALDDQRIVKLYFPDFPARLIEDEADMARLASSSGVRTPAVLDSVTIKGRSGLVYERVDGRILLEDIRARPSRAGSYARQMAELHASIHRAEAPDAPLYFTHIHETIAAHFAGQARDRLLAHLDGLPEGAALCHGDFHPENIILSGSGPVIIDWMNAGQGHPLADVARTSIMLTIGSPPHVSPLIRLVIWLIRRQFHEAYIRHYCALTGATRAQIYEWKPVIAAARTAENIPGERSALDKIISRVTRS